MWLLPLLTTVMFTGSTARFSDHPADRNILRRGLAVRYTPLVNLVVAEMHIVAFLAIAFECRTSQHVPAAAVGSAGTRGSDRRRRHCAPRV